MKHLITIVVCLFISQTSFSQTPLGSEFTYQGELQFNNSLANGNFDFTFKLYDDVTAGSQVDTNLVINSVNVINGIFTTTLDFGYMAFMGDNIWLDISVKSSSDAGAFQQLLPRKQITSTPYAIHAQFVGADAVTGLEILNGSITSADLASNSVGFNQIAANAVRSSEIATNAVGSPEIANNAVGSSEIAINAVTSAQIATGAVRSSEILANAVRSEHIATDAVGSSEIATDAVGSSELKSNSVGSIHILTNAVGSSEIATDAVGSSELKSNSVGSIHILTNAVGSSEIAPNAVGSSEIARGAVGANEVAINAITRRSIQGVERSIYRIHSRCVSANTLTTRTTCQTDFCIAGGTFKKCSMITCSFTPNTCDNTFIGYLLSPVIGN